jgi:uncharacterized Zn finger protein
VPDTATALCACGETLTFASFDEEHERVHVTCFSCGRVWLMNRTDKGWAKVVVSETLPDGYKGD